MRKNMLWVLGWRSKHTYHCAPQARNCVFGSLQWVCVKCTMSRNTLTLTLNRGRTHLGPRTGGKMVCTLLLVTKTQCDVLAPVMVLHTIPQIAHLATYGCMVTACPPRSYLRQGAKQAGVPSYAPPGSASYQLSSLGGVTYQRKYQEPAKKLVWEGLFTK